MRISCLVMVASLLCLGPAHAAGVPPRGWVLEGKGAAQYDAGAEAVAGARGARSAFLRNVEAQGADASMVQRFDAHDYAGRRILLAGSLKTNGAGAASLFITVDGKDGVLSGQSTVPIGGTKDWESHAVVLDVPSDATSIRIGFGLKGQGTVWADDFSFAIVKKDVPLTSTGAPIYGGWTFTAYQQRDFRAGSEATEGAATGASFIESPFRSTEIALRNPVNPWERGSASMRAWRAVTAFRGKRVRISTRLKTDVVDGQSGCLAALYSNGGELPLKGYHPLTLSGTRDWRSCAVVMRIPDDATQLMFRYYLAGSGRIWSDGLRLEEVGPEVPATNVQPD